MKHLYKWCNELCFCGQLFKILSNKFVAWMLLCHLVNDLEFLETVCNFFILTLCLLDNFPCVLSSAGFFQNHLFRKIISGIIFQSDKTVWIQIRADKLSGLILVQTVCKGYQQTTLVDKELK